MSKRIQLRRGTAVENDNFTGAVGEVTVDTTNNTLRVHDGTTVGGTELAKASQLPTPASTTERGLIEIATQTEVNAGTDNTRAIVPNTLLGGMKTHLSATGSAPIYACRAWVNFNGTGTVAIRANGNVSSITDNGTGDYTINFTTALPDSNYAVALGNANGGQSISSPEVKANVSEGTATLKTTTQLRIACRGNASTTLYDAAEIYVGVFR